MAMRSSRCARVGPGSNTAKAVFALTSCHKWALSGTPLQNRVAELYSQIRFLEVLNPNPEP